MEFEKVKAGVRKITFYLEFILALFLITAVGIGMLDLVRYLILIFTTNPIDTYDLFQKFLGHVLLLVVGVELVIMLVYHSPSSVIEVLLYAVARKLLIGNQGMADFSMGILAIAAIFAIRKFLFVEDLSFSTSKGYGFVATTSVKAINEILNTSIPESPSITIGGYVNSYALSKGIQLYKGVELEISEVKFKVLKIRNGVLQKIAINIDKV
jgi:hypothetical protein